MPHEASLCRVCAGDVDNAVKHWSMRARGSATSSKFTSKKAQWQLLEKAIVLSRGKLESSDAWVCATFVFQSGKSREFGQVKVSVGAFGYGARRWN